MERLICLLIGYLFGNFPTGYLYAKFHGIDITKYDYDEYVSLFSVVFQDFQLLSLCIKRRGHPEMRVLFIASC